MKTIVLGYASTDAKGPAKVLAGPEVSGRDQILLITGIKGQNNYPIGIVRVEMCELIQRQVGILIGEPKNKKSESK